ncbi:hypothetical protein CC78DRAFT_130068 [Lojkania enalia]|uniref:Uncharacterized protein n=1 Tax=Lojkania enalia TaxID=147567 RepID=A0A9P4NBU3_9PLEO|nr:hypothetical protein CC78DRAFT_130068 [Didymosphaeria enalia]
MTSPIEQQWTIMNHSDAVESQTQATAPEPKLELTINTKPTANESDGEGGKKAECACPIHPPKLERQDTIESFVAENDVYDRSGRTRRRAPPFRHYSPSPVRIRSGPPLETVLIPSSASLLSQISVYDGVADLPFPGRSSVYLTTFPFTERDIKKWAWLITSGVEDAFMTSPEFGADGFQPFPTIVNSNRRSRSPYYDPVDNSMQYIYLSRALDTLVIPLDSKEKIRYYIVVQQNRGSPKASKLMVAESRKAVGIIIYYEALAGNCIAFVGAALHQEKGPGKMKLRKVENLEEAAKVQKEDGVLAIVC